MYVQWNLDRPLFLSRDARMCNRRCVHPNMIGMLCTASLGPSRTVQTALRCPRPDSFAISSYWTGCGLCFVVDLVEEHADLVVFDLLNQFRNTRALRMIHNRMRQSSNSEINVHHVLIARDLIRHGLQRVVPFRHELFVSNVEAYAFMKRTCFATIRHIICMCFNNGLNRFIMCHFNVETLVAIKWTCLCFSCYNNGLPLFVGSKNGLPRSIGSYNGLPRSIMIWVWNWFVWLGTYGSLNNLSLWSLSKFWTQFFHPIMFQGDFWRKPRWFIFFLAYDFSNFHPNNFRNAKKLEAPREKSSRSIKSERTSILFFRARLMTKP